MPPGDFHDRRPTRVVENRGRVVEKPVRDGRETGSSGREPAPGTARGTQKWHARPGQTGINGPLCSARVVENGGTMTAFAMKPFTTLSPPGFRPGTISQIGCQAGEPTARPQRRPA